MVGPLVVVSPQQSTADERLKTTHEVPRPLEVGSKGLVERSLLEPVCRAGLGGDRKEHHRTIELKHRYPPEHKVPAGQFALPIPVTIEAVGMVTGGPIVGVAIVDPMKWWDTYERLLTIQSNP